MHELAEEMALSGVPRTKMENFRGKKNSEKIGHWKNIRIIQDFFFAGNLAVHKKLNLTSKFRGRNDHKILKFSGLCKS